MIAQKITPSMQELAPLIREAIALGKKVRLTVTGNSMYPLFKDRQDTVVLAPITKIKKRDVVFYCRPNGQYVLHRVLKIKGDRLTLAGDNETKKETNISLSDCIARMISFERFKKPSDVTDLWYKMYSFFWVMVFPVRGYCRWLLHIGARLFKK